MEEQNQARNEIWSLIQQVEKVIQGKQINIIKILATMIAGGNILLEDVPGVGKTLLCRTLAKSVSGDFKRVQFTPDVLPSDITGVTIYDENQKQFRFIKGPVFTNILLADEINRAAPKTQSALLEAMEERQVSFDNHTYDLPTPFFVLATKNPLDDAGTYPMPLAQLDRFWIRLNMGYPSAQTELEIVQNQLAAKTSFDQIVPITTPQHILQWRSASQKIHVAPELIESTIRQAEKTRNNSSFVFGLSPRAVIQLIKIAKALALIQGRDYVIIDDLKFLATDVFSHRLIGNSSNDFTFQWEPN
jgi:MoxR-like ATPase